MFNCASKSEKKKKKMYFVVSTHPLSFSLIKPLGPFKINPKPLLLLLLLLFYLNYELTLKILIFVRPRYCWFAYTILCTYVPRIRTGQPPLYAYFEKPIKTSNLPEKNGIWIREQTRGERTCLEFLSIINRTVSVEGCEEDVTMRFFMRLYTSIRK